MPEVTWSKWKWSLPAQRTSPDKEGTIRARYIGAATKAQIMAICRDRASRSVAPFRRCKTQKPPQTTSPSICGALNDIELAVFTSTCSNGRPYFTQTAQIIPVPCPSSVESFFPTFTLLCKSRSLPKGRFPVFQLEVRYVTPYTRIAQGNTNFCSFRTTSRRLRIWDRFILTQHDTNFIRLKIFNSTNSDTFILESSIKLEEIQRLNNVIPPKHVLNTVPLSSKKQCYFQIEKEKLRRDS